MKDGKIRLEKEINLHIAHSSLASPGPYPFSNRNSICSSKSEKETKKAQKKSD